VFTASELNPKQLYRRTQRRGERADYSRFSAPPRLCGENSYGLIVFNFLARITRAMLPGVFMLNTNHGIFRSIESVIAVRSMTATGRGEPSRS